MKIAILGAGAIASKMATTLNVMSAEYEPYAVASRDLSKAQAFADQYHFAKAYGSYEEMLADPEVDLVYVATPHALHFEHASLCIRFGKPVIVEKPFTVNAKQAEELYRLAEEHHVFITEAMWTRYLPGAQILRNLLDSGVIGKVTLLTGDVSYPIVDKPRMTDPSLGGGSLLDLGVYALSFAELVFGNNPLSVSGTCIHHESGVDLTESMVLTFTDGIAALGSSMCTASPNSAVICGENGYIRVKGMVNITEIEVYDSLGKLIDKPNVPDQLTGFEYEVEACRKAIAEGKIESEILPHSETLAVTRWMDTLRTSWNVIFPFEK